MSFVNVDNSEIFMRKSEKVSHFHSGRLKVNLRFGAELRIGVLDSVPFLPTIGMFYFSYQCF